MESDKAPGPAIREIVASLFVPWALGLEKTGLEEGSHGSGGEASVMCHTHVRKHLLVGGDTSGFLHLGRDCGARGFVGDFFFSPFFWLISSGALGMRYGKRVSGSLQPCVQY